MIDVTLKNPRILKLLNEYKEHCETYKNIDAEDKLWFLEGDLVDKSVHPVSQEYLNIALENTNPMAFNFPNRANLLALEDLRDAPSHQSYVNKARKITKKFMSFIGLEYNALIAVYPPKGHIGWHHNGKATGLNVLFTYSENGNGYFEYRDPETKEIVRIDDRPGWQMKLGYYPALEENDIDDLFWHCAYTDDWRYTIAFIVDDDNMNNTLKNLAEKEE